MKRKAKANRLINEKSPYLLQHAYNPVDWYPWGDEAFDAAAHEDKPIFLSIGYATCHWCHVMEVESFENVEIADMMNEAFINIKVDREELPEVDQLYMEFAQSMMSGSAGWPLTILLTPDLSPFFAATYLPPESSDGLIGMVEMIDRIKQMWSSKEQENVIAQAQRMVEVFQESVQAIGVKIPEKFHIEDAAEMFFKIGDPIYGGIKGAPKFPIGYIYNFLLRYSKKKQDSRALFLAEKSVDMMQRGGIWDHLAGGFSRYSTDEKWLIPHFEKMLYDNAILASTYMEAWQATHKELYRQVAKEIVDYVINQMTHPYGGFYSGEDADSEGEEGKYYAWSYSEVIALLGKHSGTFFCEYFDITKEGNFEGRNIPHTPVRLEEFAASRGLDQEEFLSLIKEQKQILLEERAKRVKPIVDDKIISAWNGLMIHALAESSVILGDPIYLEKAVRGAQFIREHLWSDGILYRRWREGEAKHPAILDDYAFLIKGLISLFEQGAGSVWLEWAIEMTQILERDYKELAGAFYLGNGQDPNILIRKCQFSDGSEPSGNAIHCENLLRLYQITLNSHYRFQAEDILKAVEPLLENYSPSFAYHMMNLLRYYDKDASTLVFALNKTNQFKEELHHLTAAHFLPHKFVIWKTEDDPLLLKHLPFLQHQTPINGKTTLYLCKHGACEKPITEISEMIEVISTL